MADDFDDFDSILTPDQLRTLMTVSERGSFNKAATTLGVKQSAITQIVARLERKIGRRIFQRSANGVSVTPDGEAVLIYAQAMITLNRDLAKHLRDATREEVLCIGMTEDASRTALTAVLALFVRGHRNVRMSVSCGLSDAVMEKYDQDALDVVVARRRPEMPRGEILWKEDTVWVASPDFTLDASEPIPLIVPPPGATRSTIMSAIQQSSRPWRVVFESESLSTLEAAVRAGIGISAAPSSMHLLDLVHLGEDTGELPQLPPSIFVLEKRRVPRSLFAEAFCDMFRTATRLSYGGEAP